MYQKLKTKLIALSTMKKIMDLFKNMSIIHFELPL
jgi:hypothetical protein